MNYFELYDIPFSLKPDQQIVKQKFYELSRKYHPDFFTQETEMEQADALEISSMVNKAYKTFRNQDETIKYVLQQKGILEDDEKYQLPPDFLMDVMELNEQLQDAKAESDTDKLHKVNTAISNMQQEIFEPVQSIINDYNGATSPIEELQPVKEYYFKKKYLDRILATI
jgi:molecular chaperone HscB